MAFRVKRVKGRTPPLESLTLPLKEIHSNNVLFEYAPGVIGIVMNRGVWEEYGQPQTLYVGRD